jgi:hypothetical protein
MNKPFNIFDKTVPVAKSIILSDLEMTTDEFDALKKQIVHGLGKPQPAAEVPDELANAVGEFGSATNPIGCASVPACITYLRRLRTADGRRIQFVRKGSIVDIAVSKLPIDVYDVIGTDYKVLTTIYMSGYQRSDLNVAPEGFKLMNRI